MIRGLLAELGIEMAQGLHHALDLATRIARGAAPAVPEPAVRIITGLAGQIGDLQVRLTAWRTTCWRGIAQASCRNG
jgi:transposase